MWNRDIIWKVCRAGGRVCVGVWAANIWNDYVFNRGGGRKKKYGHHPPKL